MDEYLAGQVLMQKSVRDPSWVLFPFWVDINDLADGLSSNAKLLADDSSFNSVIDNVETFAN